MTRAVLSITFCTMALLGTSSRVPGAVSAEATALQELTVSEGLVSGNSRSSSKVADVFAERIELGRDFTAKRGRACPWHEVPKGYAAESHVNIVELRLGARLELLAFMVDEDSTVSLAARAQALFQKEPWFRLTLSPGDSQWPENAPCDLVAQFAHATEERSASRGVYQLTLESWEREQQIGEGFGAMEDLGPVRDAGLMRIYPLAAAAMYAEQYQACVNPRENSIVLRIRLDEMECAVHAVLSKGGKAVYELEQHGIRYESLYDGLRVLFLNLLEWQGSVAASFSPSSSFEPLLAMEVDNPGTFLESQTSVLVGKDRDGFVSLNVGTGERLWTVPFDDKEESGTFWDGQLFLCRKSRLTRISATTGKAEFSVETKSSRHMSIRRDLCADGLYHEIRLLDQGKEVWTCSLPWTIRAGPLVTDDGVVLGDASGEFRCFSLEGQEVWKVTLPTRVSGDIYSGGGLFFAGDDTGRMYVVDQQGKLAWQADIGEVMASRPQVVDDTVVIGAKSGGLFLFDKNTGEALRNHQFKSWLLGCRVIGKKVVCMTLAKRFHILDLETFEQEEALRVPFRLNPGVLPVERFPRRRTRGEGDLAEKVAGCLLSDVKGNVFLYSMAPRP